MSRARWTVLLSMIALACELSSSLAGAAEPQLKQGDRIVFLGDPITQQGAGAKGYSTFVEHLQQHNAKNDEKGILTTDRVRLNEAGNKLVAETMLPYLGQ